MEFVFILILIAIFASVLTGNLGYVLLGMTGLLLLTSGLLVLIFLICSALLLTSKWKPATFVGIDYPTDKAKYKVAFYLVEGEEIPCLFPEEGVFRDKFYKEDLPCRVLVNRKLGRVFDRYAVCTCILGLVSGATLGLLLLSTYY